MKNETFVPFVKMHGAGNDFIMMMAENLPKFPLDSSIIARICDRRRGIGADGLIALDATVEDVDFRMYYYNSDGHEAQMCGNGARCCFALAASRGLVGAAGRFASAAGFHRGRLLREGQVEIELTGWSDLDPDLNLGDAPWTEAGFCNTGVPHLVVLLPEEKCLGAVDLEHWGPLLRRAPQFGIAGCNVNWVAPRPQDGSFLIRTFERGVEAETLACGTGASATAVILCQRGLAKSPVRIRTRGGDDLVVRVELDSGHLFLQGPAMVSFTGKVNLHE